jgi:uncharacterized phage protein (TIGR01671 family)
MRTIKFRGKHLNENEWYHGSLIVEDENNCTIVGNDFGEVPVIPETVGQCTGLRDKNGKEIYEGDILRSGVVIYECIYECGRFCFKHFAKSYNICNAAMVVVIGNIHDTPELIKDK